jgi:hypothetical protein
VHSAVAIGTSLVCVSQATPTRTATAMSTPGHTRRSAGQGLRRDGGRFRRPAGGFRFGFRVAVRRRVAVPVALRRRVPAGGAVGLRRVPEGWTAVRGVVIPLL